MKVTILRGISGSGKSTWVKNNAVNATIVSADNFFVQEDGEYVFDEMKIHEAHQACYREFLAALERKDALIVVDNTNITAWEMSPYILAAEVYGYVVEILTLRCDPEVAIARKNLVDPGKVRRSAKRLDEEARRLPAHMKAMHRVVQTDR